MVEVVSKTNITIGLTEIFDNSIRAPVLFRNLQTYYKNIIYFICLDNLKKLVDQIVRDGWLWQ